MKLYSVEKKKSISRITSECQNIIWLKRLLHHQANNHFQVSILRMWCVWILPTLLHHYLTKARLSLLFFLAGDQEGGQARWRTGQRGGGQSGPIQWPDESRVRAQHQTGQEGYYHNNPACEKMSNPYDAYCLCLLKDVPLWTKREQQAIAKNVSVIQKYGGQLYAFKVPWPYLK